MNVKFPRRPWHAIAFAVVFAVSQPAQAQSGAALSGTVTSTSGAAVPAAKNLGQKLEHRPIHGLAGRLCRALRLRSSSARGV